MIRSRIEIGNKFKVVRPWFGPLQKYTKQVGELISVQKSSLDPKYDGLTLKMPDGEYKMFSRMELEEADTEGKVNDESEEIQPEGLPESSESLDDDRE